LEGVQELKIREKEREGGKKGKRATQGASVATYRGEGSLASSWNEPGHLVVGKGILLGGKNDL